MKRTIRLVITLLLLFIWNGMIFPDPLIAQDIPDVDELVERYKSQLEQIQSKEEAEVFFGTHLKDQFGLTNNLLGFANELSGGLYNRQIEYIMNVPEQRWNPNAGAGGWGRYDRVNVNRIVNRQVKGSLHNVSDAMSKISLGLTIYGLIVDTWNGIYGDEQARLRTYKTMFDLYITLESMRAGWPGMGIASFGAFAISYAFDKFINTTLNEYNEYWWLRYQDYLFDKYPSFVNDWYQLAKSEGMEALESRLYEYWDSQAQFDVDNASTNILYRNSEYAKNMLAESFAARYYRDYIHSNLKQRILRENGQAQVESKNAVRSEMTEMKQLVEELLILRDLIRLADDEMNARVPERLTITPDNAVIHEDESVHFTAMAIYEDGTSLNITDSEETVWSTGGSLFSAETAGEHQVTVSYRGLSAETVVTVEVNLPVSLIISPNQASLAPGEEVTLRLLAIFEDGSTMDVTELEATSWDSGSSTFTAGESGTFVITATYTGLAASATVTVTEEEVEEIICEENEVPGETGQTCVCAEGYERSDGLGTCINLDDAIDEVMEEEALCDEEALTGQLARLNEIVANGSQIAANYQTALINFMKEIDDQNSSPCGNNLVAITYAGGREYLEEHRLLADEARDLGTDLILEGALCPLEGLELEVDALLQRIAQVGEQAGMIEQGVAEMENLLQTYSCDVQDVANLGDTMIAERGADPEVVRGGGIGNYGGDEFPGTDGPQGTPEGGLNVSATNLTFTSSLRVSVNFNFHNFEFVLGSLETQQQFIDHALQAGDRVEIIVGDFEATASYTFTANDLARFREFYSEVEYIDNYTAVSVIVTLVEDEEGNEEFVIGLRMGEIKLF